jgi:hypothetical protein
MPAGHREAGLAEIRQKQQDMTKEMNQGRGGAGQGQSIQQDQTKSPSR